LQVKGELFLTQYLFTQGGPCVRIGGEIRHSAGQSRLSWRAWRPLRDKEDISENEAATQIVDAAYKVHVALGPGLLESAYEAALVFELHRRGLSTARQVLVPIFYESTLIESGFRADLIVQDSVIVEIKSVEAISAVHKKQLLTYLRLSGRRLGLLINFNVRLIKDGITRIVDNLPE